MESTKYYLGLDVGGTNMVAGVVDENHQIIAKESIPTQAGRTIEEITTDMAEVSKKAVLKAGLQMEDISSWGIGMPSYVNPKTNLLVHANCFGWKNVPIYDYLKKHISLPTYIANDANCATYGEVLAGSASQYTDAIMLTLGTGVGGGIIMGKRIYSGADNMGAELGHTKLVYNGERCTCGQKGCLEAYCSSTALIRIMKEALQENKDTLIWKLCGEDENKVNGEILFEAAKAVWEAGAEIIALDCTSQITHEGRPAYELLPIVKKEIPEAIIFADVSNYEEAVRAVEMGADIVGPTLYGYTEATKHIEQPDLREFARMCRDFKDKAYVIMEGHIYSPEDAMKCIFLGAHSVVVGSAITRPHLITKRFTDLLTGYQNNWREAERSKH